MKKKIVSVIMMFCLSATLAMGCGDTKENGAAGTETAANTAQSSANGGRADLVLGGDNRIFRGRESGCGL